MALTPGTKLGPYEIQSPLGAGGMGEVYRARDTRLDRAVAIKILPAHLSDNPEAKQRFDREARAVSSLNHPNICTLHDVGHHEGTDYLVMEFLEGETLAARLIRGPLPPAQVLKCGIEICEGLETAHKKGVVHRDLKPGNIMLTKSCAKLMDFGLAKATAPIASSYSSLTMTLSTPAGSHPLTAQGTVVGTFQYMSPEQVEGKEADPRSDIFALGAVLYEMATGKRAFEGKTTASVIAAVLAAEPQPISAIQPMSPPSLDRVVKTCIAKDPDERFQNVHDVKLQLQWIAEGGSQAGVPAPVAAQRKTRDRVAWIVAAVAVLAALALSLIHFREPAPQARVVRSTILPPDNGTFVFLGRTSAPMLSPDGRNVVFLARVAGVTQLWVRALDSFKPHALAGTEDAYGAFWSPDSRNIGFFAQGKLKRIAAAGGPPLILCDVDQARGGSWNRQDIILFAKYPGEIYRIPASGGVPQQVTHLDLSRHDTTHKWPYFLPDDNHFLYMASTLGTASDENVIFAGSLDGNADRILFHATSPVAYDSGYLLYIVNKTLMARPFDAAKLEFTGDPVPVAEGVQFDRTYSSGVFSASGTGMLLYQTGNASSERKLDLLDASGKTLSPLSDPLSSSEAQVSSDGKPVAYVLMDVNNGGARISPDGKRVAYVLLDANSGKADIWIYDIASGNRTRLTIDPVLSQFPVWSHDSTKIAYSSTRSGKPVTYVKSANGMGLEQKLWEPAFSATPNDWTLDSKTLTEQDRAQAGAKARLLMVPADGKGEPTTLLEVPGANVVNSRLSADNRWIAYQSDETGRYEVYVSAFPKPAGRLQISQAGGRLPTWRMDGKELYYLDPDGKLMAAELHENNGSLQVAASRVLFSIKMTTGNGYDAFPDGKKFLTSTVTTGETPAPLSLVLNWTAELKK
jgi:eukaryotic-like serine/threonine-protein kinase